MPTSTPGARRRSSGREAFMSLPVMRWPIAASTAAMALMPAPPTPTMWTVERQAQVDLPLRPGCSRPCSFATDSASSGHLLGRRPCDLQPGRARRHGLERGPGRRPGTRRLLQRARPSSRSSGTRMAAPGQHSAAAFLRWWSFGAPGSGTRALGVPIAASSATVDRAGPARRRSRRARAERASAARSRPGGSRARLRRGLRAEAARGLVPHGREVPLPGDVVDRRRRPRHAQDLRGRAPRR